MELTDLLDYPESMKILLFNHVYIQSIEFNKTLKYFMCLFLDIHFRYRLQFMILSLKHIDSNE